MANPRIEEVEDDDIDDPEEMDLDAFDFAKPQGSLQPLGNESGSQMSPQAIQAMLQQQQQNPASRTAPPQMSDQERQQFQRDARERTKSFQCIYPVYFDASRSREQGRRVKKEDAVQNPLAWEIVNALQHIGNSMGVPLQIAFEPDKGHPKDWGNPGRVRVLVKKEGRAISGKIGSSKSFCVLGVGGEWS